MGSIQLGNVTRIYAHSGRDQVKALDSLNLEIAAGEMLVIVGPSASGKTTLLRVIAGLEQVTGGTIQIDGRL